MYIGTQPYSGIRARHTYTATAGQTSFSGAGAENVTLTYSDELYIDVYQNGVKLSPADYTATSGTTVVLATGATVSDIVEVVKYDAFSVADTVSAKDGGGFGGNISTSGTLAVTGTSTLTGNVTAAGRVIVDDTTDATSTTDGSLQTDGGLSIVKDAVFGDDVKLLSDASVLSFGADSDVTLTHVADTGILLNSTMAIQFNDASQFINAPSATVLDINATDEIELNATLVDVNANINVSGTYIGGGLMQTGGSIVIPDAGNIGSASDTDSIAIASDGVVTLTQKLIGTELDISGNMDIDGTSNLDVVDIDGAIWG